MAGCRVRKLRHYDAIGLLRPAHVDPVTRYRPYEIGQLGQLVGWPSGGASGFRGYLTADVEN